MSLTPSEIEVIETVASELSLGPIRDKYPGTCDVLAARLRALLPKPETLEECVEGMLAMWNRRPDMECRVVDSRGGDPFCDRLRAALERRRKEQGK